MANQSKFWVFTISCFLIISACGSDKDRTPETIGKIVVEAVTKGTHQYLIEIKDQLYWPENLPARFQDPNFNDVEVLLRFIKKDIQKDIYLPSPIDIPVFAYTVPVIQILEIKEK